jgi:hypothetical protein
MTYEQHKANFISDAIKASNGNVPLAAQKIKVTTRTMYRWIKKYNTQIDMYDPKLDALQIYERLLAEGISQQQRAEMATHLLEISLAETTKNEDPELEQICGS